MREKSQTNSNNVLKSIIAMIMQKDNENKRKKKRNEIKFE